MFNKIRKFSIVLCFVIFALGAVVLRYCVLIFPELFIKNKEKKLKICLKILQKSWQIHVALMEFLRIIKLNKQELEKIKGIKNSIIVSTHPSFIDVVIIMSTIPNTTCFVAEKMAKNPFFKGMVDLLFILDSKNIQAMENSAVNMLEMGFNVLIFPMGSRHKIDEHPKIRKGASLLAQKSNKNIAMIKMTTDYVFLMKNQSIYEIQQNPAEFTITYLGDINTKSMLEKYPDEVTFRHEVTKLIEKNLY